jgi:hypothetical protein
MLENESLESDSNSNFVDQSESESDVLENPELETKQYQQQKKKSPTFSDDSSNG